MSGTSNLVVYHRFYSSLLLSRSSLVQQQPLLKSQCYFLLGESWRWGVGQCITLLLLLSYLSRLRGLPLRSSSFSSASKSPRSNQVDLSMLTSYEPCLSILDTLYHPTTLYRREALTPYHRHYKHCYRLPRRSYPYSNCLETPTWSSSTCCSGPFVRYWVLGLRCRSCTGLFCLSRNRQSQRSDVGHLARLGHRRYRTLHWNSKSSIIW